jgi:hypothetical protein
MLRPSPYLVAIILVPLISAALISTRSFSKGGNYRSEDRYDPQHIESLPPEVRDAVIRLCPAPRALHNLRPTRTTFNRSCCTSNIYTAGLTHFAGRPAACIKPTFRPAAATVCCEASTRPKEIEFKAASVVRLVR